MPAGAGGHKQRSWFMPAPVPPRCRPVLSQHRRSVSVASRQVSRISQMNDAITTARKERAMFVPTFGSQGGVVIAAGLGFVAGRRLGRGFRSCRLCALAGESCGDLSAIGW